MTEDEKPDFINGPKAPEWMVKQAEKWRRLVALGILVHVPMSPEELADETDYGL